MKKLHFIILVIFVFALGCSDSKTDISNSDSSKSITKLEKFSSKKGELYVKDFCNIGQIKDKYTQEMNFDAIVLYKPGDEGNRLKGLRIELKTYAGYGSSKTETSFLDMEELESLSKSIDYMLSLATKWKLTEREYSEVKFMTIGNFGIGFYQSKKELTAYANNGVLQNNYFLFNTVDELSSLKDKINNSIQTLNSK